MPEFNSALSTIAKFRLTICVEISRQNIIQRRSKNQGMLRTKTWIIFTWQLVLCLLHLFIFWPVCLCALFFGVICILPRHLRYLNPPKIIWNTAIQKQVMHRFWWWGWFKEPLSQVISSTEKNFFLLFLACSSIWFYKEFIGWPVLRDSCRAVGPKKECRQIQRSSVGSAIKATIMFHSFYTCQREMTWKQGVSK